MQGYKLNDYKHEICANTNTNGSNFVFIFYLSGKKQETSTTISSGVKNTIVLIAFFTQLMSVFS